MPGADADASAHPLEYLTCKIIDATGAWWTQMDASGHRWTQVHIH